MGMGLEESLSLYGAGTLQRFAAEVSLRLELAGLLRELLDPNSKLAVAIGEQFGNVTPKKLIKLRIRRSLTFCRIS